MLIRLHRHSKKILLVVAALPLLQTGACNPAGTALQIWAGFTNIIVTSTTQLLVQNTITNLLGVFPGSNLLRGLLLNTGFFPGL